MLFVPSLLLTVGGTTTFITGDMTVSGNTANGVSNFIHNEGTLNINTDGTLVVNDAITGTNGVMHINNKEVSDRNNGTISLNSTISGNNINLDGGILLLNASGNIDDTSTLTANGGTLSLANGVIGNKEIANVNLVEDLIIGIDVDLTIPDSDKFTSSNIEYNGKSILISIINIASDVSNSATRVNVANEAMREHFGLADDIYIYAENAVQGYSLEYEKETGDIVLDTSLNVVKITRATNRTRNYVMGADEVIKDELEDFADKSSIGVLGNDDAVLTINGNGYSIDGTDADSLGFVVNAGQTLNLRNIGSATLEYDEDGNLRGYRTYEYALLSVLNIK